MIMLHIEDFVRAGCRLGYVPEVCCPRDLLQSRGSEYVLTVMVSKNSAAFKTSGTFENLFINQKNRISRRTSGRRGNGRNCVIATIERLSRLVKPN